MRVPPMKECSAWLPIAMSLAASALLLGHVSIYGIVRQADEGAAARLWQLIMVSQLPIVIYFAAKWLPQSPGAAVRVLALQFAAGVAAVALVLWLES